MSSLGETRKPRPAQEWSSEVIFRPLAQVLVDPLAKKQVNPLHVVAFHTLLGLYIAQQIHRGQRLAPALLLQVRTVLDGLDGQLARATGQTTETGRYFDTEMDLLMNLALNIAIEGKAGVPITLLQSLILTVDYLWERDYREARGEVFRAPPAQSGNNPQFLAALKAIYAAYFIPQERLLSAVFEQRLRTIVPEPTQAQCQQYTPLPINVITANLGLSTQHLLLGLCVLAGKPQLYTRTLPVQALLLLSVQLWREKQVMDDRR